MQSPTFFPKHVRGCPWGGMARRLDFAVSGCYTFKTPSSFLVQPFGTSQFLGGNWESLGRVTSVTLDFGTFESKVSDPNFPIRFRYVWCSAWKLGGYQQLFGQDGKSILRTDLADCQSKMILYMPT